MDSEEHVLQDLNLVKTFFKIDDMHVRAKIIALVEAAANDGSSEKQQSKNPPSGEPL